MFFGEQKKRPVQYGMVVKLTEVTLLIDTILSRKLPRDYLYFCDNQYLVTTIRDHSMYARNTNTQKGGDLLLGKLDNYIFIALTSSNAVRNTAIAAFEQFLDGVK